MEAGGKESETFYEVKATKKFSLADVQEIQKLIQAHSDYSGKEFKAGKTYSLVMLRPTTGRTHQLRVHMNYLGTPIVGDRVYGSAKPNTTDRLYLHAASLEITIPESRRVTFTTDFPPEFQIFNQ